MLLNADRIVFVVVYLWLVGWLVIVLFTVNLLCHFSIAFHLNMSYINMSVCRFAGQCRLFSACRRLVQQSGRRRVIHHPSLLLSFTCSVLPPVLWHSGFGCRRSTTHTHTHTHSHFTALCPGLPGWASTRRDIDPLTPAMCCGSLSSFWILWGVGKIIEASTSTIWLDATLSGPTMPPPPSSRQFYAGCPPNLFWLGTGTIYAGLHTWRLGYLEAWKSIRPVMMSDGMLVWLPVWGKVQMMHP